MKDPDIKFKKGDIVEIKNTKNRKSIFVLIEKFIFGGLWTHCEDCGLTYGAVNKIIYAITIQENSFTDKKEYIPMRPGLSLTYNSVDLHKFDVVKWDNKIIEADHPNNIRVRQVLWRSRLSEYQREKNAK